MPSPTTVTAERPIRGLALTVDPLAPSSQILDSVRDALEIQRPGSLLETSDLLEFLGPNGSRVVHDLNSGALSHLPMLSGPIPPGSSSSALLNSFSGLFPGARLQELSSRVLEASPDILLATHPIASRFIAALIRGSAASTKAAVLISDHLIHPGWISHGIDVYLVPSLRQAESIASYLPPSGTVVVTGIPAPLPFETPPNRALARQTLGLKVDRFTVALLRSGLDANTLLEAGRALSDLRLDLQIAVMAGTDSILRESLGNLTATARIPMSVLAPAASAWDVLAAADLAVASPAGPLCAQALAYGVPLVAFRPLPGAEQANAQWLSREEAAVVAASAPAARGTVAELLAAPARLNAMRQSALELGRPFAARAVASCLVSAVTGEVSTALRNIPIGFQTRVAPLGTTGKLGGILNSWLTKAEEKLTQTQASRSSAPSPSSGSSSPTPTKGPSAAIAPNSSITPPAPTPRPPSALDRQRDRRKAAEEELEALKRKLGSK